MKVQIRFSKTVNIDEVPDQDEIQLVTNSQDMESIVDYFCGKDKRRAKRFEQFHSYFVECSEGDYNAVYGCTSSVPRSNHRVTPIKRLYISK